MRNLRHVSINLASSHLNPLKSIIQFVNRIRENSIIKDTLLDSIQIESTLNYGITDRILLLNELN